MQIYVFFCSNLKKQIKKSRLHFFFIGLPRFASNQITQTVLILHYQKMSYGKRFEGVILPEKE